MSASSDLLVEPLSYSFQPIAGRGVLIDERVRRHLAQSISNLGEAISPDRPDYGIALTRLTAALDAGPVRADLVVLYADLVTSIFRDDRPTFLAAMEALVDLEPNPGQEVRALALADADLGARMADRFLRHIDEDPSAPIELAPISPAELAAARDIFAAAHALIDTADHQLWDEMRSIIRDIIFVGSETEGGEFKFHGASTFYWWGAVLLNAHAHHDRLSMADGLTHEAAHSLLHGYTLGAPLVENDPGERYPSPLRPDLRPVDGIVHAAYVVARLHYLMERLLASKALNAVETARAEAAKIRYASDFLQGLSVVVAHARFTPIGHAIFESARKHMRDRGIH